MVDGGHPQGPSNVAGVIWVMSVALAIVVAWCRRLIERADNADARAAWLTMRLEQEMEQEGRVWLDRTSFGDIPAPLMGVLMQWGPDVCLVRREGQIWPEWWATINVRPR